MNLTSSLIQLIKKQQLQEQSEDASLTSESHLDKNLKKWFQILIESTESIILKSVAFLKETFLWHLSR